MKIVRIIVDPEPTLYAIRFPEHQSNEFDKNFDLWNDPEYLRTFFKDHSGDLRSYNHFHNTSYSIEHAIKKTLRDAQNLENKLLDIAESKNEYEELKTLFVPLNDFETEFYPLQESKGKLKYGSWLRIYAIRIDSDLFVITGGAIKLTKKMKEREHTRREVTKMKKAVTFLRSENLINEDEFKRLELGL